MNKKENSQLDKRKLFHAFFIPSIITILIFISFIFEKGMDLDFHKAGVLPRSISHLWGIFTYVFVHSNWSHLLNNLLSFFVLSVTLYYFYNQIANKVLFFAYLSSGLILWLIGRENYHIGASGLIYALVFFQFFSGLIRMHIPLIAISLVIAFLYGSFFWHLFPWQQNDPISWEGHLSGGLSGLILSVVFRNSGPQKPLKDWGEEENEELEKDDDLTELLN